MFPGGGILPGGLVQFPFAGLLGRRPPLKISNSGVVFGRQVGIWLDSEMVPARDSFRYYANCYRVRYFYCKKPPMEKAINRAEGRVSRTTDDEFVSGRFSASVMMLSSAHPTNTRRAIWDRGYFLTVNHLHRGGRRFSPWRPVCRQTRASPAKHSSYLSICQVSPH
jgi:hypothetical protein